ncbi:MAG TPA: 5-(carboxyamino)imidazole ribonucleotide mutase [Phycisphaerae bacterium]|nr:5-(carboxyamino)imidazole ribonucleotide mutase [Phycisphaerae bacterium]
MENPVVGVVMGSDSDFETMKACTAMLDFFGISHEVRIISAHRTPDTAHEYSAVARKRGLKVIIAAAGMSAALGGVLAAGTTLPVIGIPMSAGPLAGVDAALSTMQMPPGIPVACMAIGSAGAQNAAIFAAEILGVTDTAIAEKLQAFKKEMAEKCAAKDAKLRQEL